jgi:hypothetical protein
MLTGAVAHEQKNMVENIKGINTEVLI